MYGGAFETKPSKEDQISDDEKALNVDLEGVNASDGQDTADEDVKKKRRNKKKGKQREN